MSDFLQWSDRYATGIEAVDSEHRTLFRMINALHRALEDTDAEIDLAGLFVQLDDYVETHFVREERLMEAAGYPNLARHRAEHRALSATLRRFMDELAQAPDAFPMEDFLDFLGNWLAQHVVRVDMDYVPHVTGDGPA